MKFTQIRHGSHLLHYNKLTLLVDPVLADQGTYAPIPAKGRCNRNPLVSLPFNLDFLKNIDVVLLTHLHNDHFDKKAIQYLDKELPIICHSADAEKIKDHGFSQVYPINGESLIYHEIKITATSGRHGYGLTAKAMGHVSGFILEDVSTDHTEPKLYVIGDSVWYPKIEETLLTYQPDIIIVFAGEARLGRSKPITMSTYDIDKIATTSGEARIIIIHLESWNHCQLTRKDIYRFISDQEYKHRILVPTDGESYSLD